MERLQEIAANLSNRTRIGLRARETHHYLVRVQMILRTWDEHEEINDTFLSFELFGRIGGSRPALFSVL